MATELDKKQENLAKLQEKVLEEKTKYALAVAEADKAVIEARVDAETVRLEAELAALQELNRDIGKKSTVNDLATQASEGQEGVLPPATMSSTTNSEEV